MNIKPNGILKHLNQIHQLLRWNKPSGRLILLVPAGWSLWLTPQAPPEGSLIVLIVIGGVLVSGAGCIANDMWDINFDRNVERTKDRPLATNQISKKTAFGLIILFLFLSILIVFLLPIGSRNACLILSFLALPCILIYPSAKRWFKYPQLLLSICWGFSVLIPWAASEGYLSNNFSLWGCWLATLFWTFGFDTVYAMADKEDDQKLGLNSSAISLGNKSLEIVSCCYAMTSILIAVSAINSNIGLLFWFIWILVTLSMQREVMLLKPGINKQSMYSKHFKKQVLLGSLLLLGLIIGTSI